MLFYVIILLLALAFAALLYFNPRAQQGAGPGGFNPVSFILNFLRGGTEKTAAEKRDKEMKNNRSDQRMENDSVIVLLNKSDSKEVSTRILPPEGGDWLTIGRDAGLSDMLGSTFCGQWHIKLQNNRGEVTAVVRKENSNGTLMDEYRNDLWLRSNDLTGETVELNLRADHIPTYLLLAVPPQVITGEVRPESISRSANDCDLVTLIRI